MIADERLFVEDRIRIPYTWPAGHIGSKGLRLLRDEQRIVGSRCARCAAVYAPPRSICLSCYKPIDAVVDVGPLGTVICTDGTLGLVLLDGATTALLHRVSAPAGSRVGADWAEARKGSILDVAGFSPTGATSEVPARYGIPFRPAGRGPRLVEEVAVIAVATTPYDADRTAWSFAEMAHEVVAEVLEKTGLTHDQIDTVITASSDFLDGRTISDMAIQDVVGAPGKSCSKVSQDGLFALLYAVARINSGLFDTALVVAHGKCSEGDPRSISQASFDPIFVRPLGLTDHSLLNLQARRLGDTDPTLAPDSDGAVAVLLARGELARRLKLPSVWLCGAGFAMQTHAPGDCDLGRADALEHAARQAYHQAGIQPDKLAIAEVMSLSTSQERLWQGALGLNDRTTAVTPSGGALERNPGFATGLERLAEVYRRLATTPGHGLAHAVSGYAGQNHAVWIARSE